MIHKYNCFVLTLIFLGSLIGIAFSIFEMKSTYPSLIRQLYRINALHPVKLDLENSFALYNKLGCPLANKPIIHVAGTNGKGSVVLKTAKCLQESGLKVGMFISPHISSFRERIQINGIPIGEDDILVSLPYFGHLFIRL